MATKKKQPRTVATQAAFLAAIRDMPCIRKAARLAGVERTVHYTKWLRDPAYKAAFEEALAQGVTTMEEEAHRRAVEGYQDDVWQLVPTYGPKGNITGYERMLVYERKRYSDQLLIAMLRANLPDKYRERLDIEGNLNVNLADRLIAGRNRVAKKPE